MKPSIALAQALRDAAHTIVKVRNGRSLSDEINRPPQSALETPRSMLIDLCHGTLRRYGWLQAVVRALSTRRHNDHVVEALLWCALYALESGRYANYTVVDQAVGACGLLEKWNAKGYVNALLRAYLRERTQLNLKLRDDPEARYQHPRWWIEAVRSAYPDGWEDILAAGNSHPPMCLRVNRRRQAPEAYQARLAAEGLAARCIGQAAILLERPVPVAQLPGFDSGDVSVQDAGAQRAGACLDLADGQRVLDACAAPGGKSGQILELADVALTSLDSDPERCSLVERNLRRLQFAADVRRADCVALESWWDGSPFDRILADVPCSASGIARRHPDIKWLRREGDIGQFATRQAAILDALWQALRPGGKLLYATCSVFPAENEDVVGAFLARTQQACRLPLPDGEPAQVLPTAGHDGFFFALIEKTR